MGFVVVFVGGVVVLLLVGIVYYCLCVSLVNIDVVV